MNPLEKFTEYIIQAFKQPVLYLTLSLIAFYELVKFDLSNINSRYFSGNSLFNIIFGASIVVYSVFIVRYYFLNKDEKSFVKFFGNSLGVTVIFILAVGNIFVYFRGILDFIEKNFKLPKFISVSVLVIIFIISRYLFLRGAKKTNGIIKK